MVQVHEASVRGSGETVLPPSWLGKCCRCRCLSFPGRFPVAVLLHKVLISPEAERPMRVQPGAAHTDVDKAPLNFLQTHFGSNEIP